MTSWGARKLLDLAAMLDRIDRGAAAPDVERDPRLVKVRQATEELLARRRRRPGGAR